MFDSCLTRCEQLNYTVRSRRVVFLFGRSTFWVITYLNGALKLTPRRSSVFLTGLSQKSATEVHAFLGLVRYVADFLPLLMDHTLILTPLTHKSADTDFPPWDSSHQVAFDAIKGLVLGQDCLTTINHDDMGENKIFVTCDASDHRTGTVLSYGLTWESVRPVAYDSMALKAAQLNYPVHEKELLAII
jgi:hypothetical protein